MWKVLLSEREPPGARGPELHEPLRTGTGGWPGPRGQGHAGLCLPAAWEGPPGDCVRWGSKLKTVQCPWGPSSWLLGITGRGTQVPRAEGKGQLRRDSEGGILEKGYLGEGVVAEKGHLATPPPHEPAHVVGLPHPTLVFLEACYQGQGRQVRPLSPAPWA